MTATRTPRQPIHATTVARLCGPEWRGLMLTGPSGAGKSDLALRLIDTGWRLVADDRSLVWACEGRLYAASPPTIAGRMEARALGIIPARSRTLARVAAVIQCTGAPIERLPEPETHVVEGLAVPLFRLNPFAASATVLAARILQTL